MTSLETNFAKIKSQLSGHKSKLLAVSKKKPPSVMRQVYQLGQRDFGENYVQEFLDKYEELKDLNIHWHFIGHLQRRKVKEIIGKVELIHSLDSIKLAYEINKQAEKKQLKQKLLIQVNSSKESTKSGFYKENLFDALEEISKLNFLEVKGLMTLPPFYEEPENLRPYFRELKVLMNKINQEKIFPKRLTELSMGMSHDFPIAIQEGSTIIRLGTILFGERV